MKGIQCSEEKYILSVFFGAVQPTAFSTYHRGESCGDRRLKAKPVSAAALAARHINRSLPIFTIQQTR